MIDCVFISVKEMEYISKRESSLIENSDLDHKVTINMIKGQAPPPFDCVLDKLRLANTLWIEH